MKPMQALVVIVALSFGAEKEKPTSQPTEFRTWQQMYRELGKLPETAPAKMNELQLKVANDTLEEKVSKQRTTLRVQVESAEISKDGEGHKNLVGLPRLVAAIEKQPNFDALVVGYFEKTPENQKILAALPKRKVLTISGDVGYCYFDKVGNGRFVVRLINTEIVPDKR